MTEFFCADESRSLGEDLVGTAGNAGMYALIECPPPWTANAFESPHIPFSLKSALAVLGRTRVSIRPLLIKREGTRVGSGTKVVLYRRNEGAARGYAGQDFDLDSLDGVAALARETLGGRLGAPDPARAAPRTIVVCTHGTNDKCCAKYGVSFHKEAVALAAERAPGVRVWQCSHIGGHRFAPTIIDFPEGRYYGALDRASFESILTRSGDIRCMNRVYRGWACLPGPAQVLERELMLLHGWEWLGYEVTATLGGQGRVEMAFRRPDGSSGRYTAEVVPDEKRSVTLLGDCRSGDPAGKPARVTKLAVRGLRLLG